MAKTPKHPRYTFLKDGSYYFSRAVPKDLQHHYKTQRIVQSLKTKYRNQAAIASKALSLRLDEYWFKLRINQMDIPAAHLLIKNDRPQPLPNVPNIDEALLSYHRLRGRNRSKAFFEQTKLSVSYLKAAVGIFKINQYTTLDASKFRDWLINQGLRMSSVHRYYSSIKAVTSFVISEYGLECSNPFANILVRPEFSRHFLFA
ncbi:MAG: hypothetical protein RL336_939 [Pseudomonadota bacterium]|jgi:hypothetical protein